MKSASDNNLVLSVSSEYDNVPQPASKQELHSEGYDSSRSSGETEVINYGTNNVNLSNSLTVSKQGTKRHSTLSAIIGESQNFIKQQSGLKSFQPNNRKTRWQLKAYNFLERPTGAKCFVYHVIVFLLVLVCLIFSVLSTVKDQKITTDETLMILETVLVGIFSLEYAIRLWSAGCISKYVGLLGRLKFARRPICLIDFFVVSASIIILLIGRQGNVFAASAIRGIRFLQILRMLHVDRQGGTWRLLGSVVYVHRQELITTLYIGFLALIFFSYFVYLVEQPMLEIESSGDDGKGRFYSYADALWWGVVTVTTIGYGDQVPQTWMGKVIASCFSVFAISFFALPAGILGSGFALKVQQNQRQKQFNRQIPAAAQLIQASWRVYTTARGTECTKTWQLYAISKKELNQNHQKNDNEEKQKNLEKSKKRSSSDLVLDFCSVNDMEGNHASKPSKMDISKVRIYRPQDEMLPSYKNAIRAVRRLIFFLAKKKFQQIRQPYDVRDVVEMYTQGHANTNMKIKELQRRIDQTLGKPSSFVEQEKFELISTNDRQRLTVAGRLQQLESWMKKTDQKLDKMTELLQEIVKCQRN